MTDDSGSSSQRLGDRRLLDSGAEAEIYEWGAGRVLRLLLPEQAERGRTLDIEVEAMRSAAAAGVPVPTIHELVTIDDRPGVVIDRIDGPAMLGAMLSRPWRMFAMARRFGEIHAMLHQRAASPDMALLRHSSEQGINRLQEEDAWLKPWTIAELDALPPGASLLHGDFHPGNVLIGPDGPSVIDWPRAASGPPEADVARTMVLVESAVPPNANWLSRALIGLVRTRIFMPRYLAGYRSRGKLDMQVVRRWRMVRTVERLAEAPASERPTLRRMIRDAGGPRDFAGG